MRHGAGHPMEGAGEGVERIIEWLLKKCAASRQAKPIAQDKVVPEPPDPKRRHLPLYLALPQGRGRETEVIAGIGKNGGEPRQHCYAQSALDHFGHPKEIAQSPPLSIKQNTQLLDHRAAEPEP